MTGDLTRRSALRGAGVFAVGGVAGAVVASSRDEEADNANANAYGHQDTSAGSGSALAEVDDIPNGGGLVLEDAKVVLTKADDGTVRAFSSICTHQGCPVSEVADGRISLPLSWQPLRRRHRRGRPGPRVPSAALRGGDPPRGGGVHRVSSRLNTIVWLLAAGFAVGALIALR